jgi:hypothetical protein
VDAVQGEALALTGFCLIYALHNAIRVNPVLVFIFVFHGRRQFRLHALQARLAWWLFAGTGRQLLFTWVQCWDAS